MGMRQSVESLEKLNFRNTKKKEEQLYRSPYAQSLLKDKQIVKQANTMFATELKSQDVRLTTIRNRSNAIHSLLQPMEFNESLKEP